jgi:RNA polymerase sigma-70 factor (sigma-E family)
VSRAEDEAQFEEFVAARSRSLGRTAYLLTGDRHLAEDLLQQALLATARHWRAIHSNPEAYARRALFHQHISWWRRRRHLTEVYDEKFADRAATDSALTGSAVTDRSDLRLSLDQALRQLTDKQRAVLVLRYYEDLTEADTAKFLGIGVGTVKSTTRQALARLRVVAPHLADLLGADR